MQSQNQILRYFDLPISQKDRQKYRNLSEEEKMIVSSFMVDKNQPNQQINGQMIKIQMQNSSDRYVQISTKKIQVLIQKPGERGNQNLYILQQVMVNPLFQRQGILKRFLTTLRNYLPENSRIMIQSVSGENLEAYITSEPHLFSLVQGTDSDYMYTP
jgi:hypothetical protein